MAERPLATSGNYQSLPKEETKFPYMCPNPNCAKVFPSALGLQTHILIHVLPTIIKDVG